MLRTDGEILPRKKHSGRWLVLGLFVLGGIVLLGFYLSPYKFDPAPAAKWAAPDKPVAVGVLQHARLTRWENAVAEVVFMTDTPGIEVDAAGKQLNMPQSPRPQVYYPGQNLSGPGTASGNAIFSRFPLHESRSIPNKGGSFGVWAVAVVGDRKFMLATVHLSPDATVRAKELDMLDRAWQELGKPPMVAGGEWQGDKPVNAVERDGAMWWGESR